jgi:Calx-beta domain
MTNSPNDCLSRLPDIGAFIRVSSALLVTLFLSPTVMAQGFTVNDGIARGTCSSFTFAGGVLALSPSNCLGAQGAGPVFSYSSSNAATISETATGLLNLTVHLQRNGNTSTLNVDVEICPTGTGCTALGGSDYTLAGYSWPPPVMRTLSFAPGETDKTFGVTIVDDAVADGAKVLTFRLSAPSSPATISGNDVGFLTITDNEAPAGTVAFSLATYQIAENNAPGKAFILVSRSNTVGAASVQVEIPVTGTTALIGTHYNVNDAASPFSGSPPTYTLNFAAGSADSFFFLPTVNNTLIEGAKVVAFNLKNPVGLTLGTPSAATLTITDDDIIAGDADINGQPVKSVTIDQLVTPNNFCAYGRFPGGGPGPCGASEMPMSTCATGMEEGLSKAWQLNMVDGTGALTYVPFKNHAIHFLMDRRQAFSWKFKTPPANQIPGGIAYGGFTQASTTIGIDAVTFMTVTSTRCDFDVNKVATSMCYRSLGGDNSVPTVLAPVGAQVDASFCRLQPDTEYFLNIRWENASLFQPGLHGKESCTPTQTYPQCGMSFGF